MEIETIDLVEEYNKVVKLLNKTWWQIPDEFKLDPPDGGDVHPDEAVLRMIKEIERLQGILKDVYETIPEHIPFGIKNDIRAALQQKESE